MFSSLRTRIWLSYSLLIVGVLILVMLGVAVGLRNSPILYRSALLRLRLAEAVVSTRLEVFVNQNIERVEKLLEREADQRQIRFLLLDSAGAVTFDSAQGEETALNGLPTPITSGVQDPVNTLRIQDAQGDTWLYSIQELPSEGYLMTALRRPRVALRTILRDELVAPFLRAGFIAVFLVLMISLWLSNWITKPILKIAASANQAGGGSFEEIELGGPTEIRQLTDAFNQMVRRLKISQQSQREFLANVSHELKTPLTTIQGFAQALMDGTIDSQEEQKNAAEIIFNDASRLHRLVLDLLTLTRLESGALNLDLQPFNVGELIQNIGKRLSIQAEQARVHLVIDLPALPTILGDGERLSQVFTNLVENGIKYTPSDGTVRIGATVKLNSVIIEVADTGQGISAEDQKRVFERFYQTDKSRKGGAERGFGLGLAIARQVVLAHQGRIWVQSEPGQGSSFFVELPTSNVVAKPPSSTV